METCEQRASDLLVAAFICMQPPSEVVALAREVGGGIVSEFVQQYFLDECVRNEVQTTFPASRTYVKSVVKKIILAAESDGQEVLEDLYDLHSELLEADNVQLTERCYKTFTFEIPENARSKLRCILGDKTAAEVIMRRLVTIRVSRNILDGGTGYCVWPAGLFLAEVLLSHPQLVHGKSCLELGSGTGICGIWLSMLAPCKTLLTEGALSSLANLRHNLAINGIPVQLENQGAPTEENRKANFKVECRQLVWELASEDEVQACKPEVIIGSDLIYDLSILPGLVRVLAMMLQENSLCSENCNGKQALDTAVMYKSKENEIITPVAYLASALRNWTTIQSFFKLAANCGLEVTDVTEALAASRILPDIHLVDRAQMRLYKVVAP